MYMRGHLKLRKLSIKMRLLLGMTVVAYPKKEAMTCIIAREKIEPANTVNLGCFIALEILYYLKI